MDGAELNDLVSLCESRASDGADCPLYSILDRANNVRELFSFGSLYTRARAIGAVLQAMDLQNIPVILWYPHGASFIESFYGSVLAGAIAVPFAKPRGSDYQALARAIVASGARTLLTVDALAKHLPTEFYKANNLTIVLTDAIDSANASSWRRPEITPESIAFIQFTSGSTSHPKGVVVTHSNVMHNSESIRRNLGLSRGDISVGWLPFYHDMGLIGHLIQPLYTGIHNYVISPLAFVSSPARWLDAMTRYKGTISGGPNFAYDLCCSKVLLTDDVDLSAWRVAYCGSETISVKTVTAFTEKFSKVGFRKAAFHACYGLAESTLFVCGTSEWRPQSLPGSSRTYCRIGDRESAHGVVLVDPLTGSAVEGDMIVGEIWTRSKSVALGYFAEPRMTLEVFCNLFEGRKGYLRTGDLGFYCEGGLYFVGRQKNLLKIRGKSLYAEDIELHVCELARQLGIGRCAALSVTIEVEEATVLLLEHDGKSPMSKTRDSVSQVRSFVCSEFGFVPTTIRVVGKDVLPLTTSGKLRRNECIERFTSGEYN